MPILIKINQTLRQYDFQTHSFTIYNLLRVYRQLIICLYGFEHIKSYGDLNAF